MKTRYIWPFKQTFYSYCSNHKNVDPNCNQCKFGTWHYNLEMHIAVYLFRYFPKVWFFVYNSHLPILKRIKHSYNFKL